MKKQIIATLILCTCLVGCTVNEQVSTVPATSPPVLTNLTVPESTTVTEPNLPQNEEPEMTVLPEEQAIEETMDAVAPAADQPAEPKAAEANLQENGAAEVTDLVSALPKPSETVPPVTETVEPESTVQQPVEAPIIETSEPGSVILETTEPQSTTSETTAPAETEPIPTEAEEPEPTEPPVEEIDISALESYGRSYASGTYGYNGTSECTPNSGAGYFPASTKTITSQEEAERIIQEAIDSQYKRDEAYGYTPYEEVDGETVRCPVNVEVTPTGEPNEYTITVYYGGTS